MREPRHLRGDECRRHEEDARLPPHQTQVLAEHIAQERARGGRAEQLQDGRPCNRDVQGAGARERLAKGEHQREQEGDGDVLDDGKAEQCARDGSVGVELAHHRHRDGGG